MNTRASRCSALFGVFALATVSAHCSQPEMYSDAGREVVTSVDVSVVGINNDVSDATTESGSSTDHATGDWVELEVVDVECCSTDAVADEHDTSDAGPGPDASDLSDAMADTDGNGTIVPGDATATAPVTCEQLPAICGNTACAIAGTSNPKVAQQYWDTALAEAKAHPVYQKLAFDAVTFWLPAELVLLDATHVRLRASWFNHVWMNPTTATSNATGGCDVCQGLKSSLLPSGCVSVVLDVDKASATQFKFQPATKADFSAASASWFDEVGCGQVLGKPPSWKTVALVLPDGRLLQAHPGRANIDALLANPDADISGIVRDVAVPGQATEAVAGVVDLSLPGSSTPATTIALDVSVCRATSAQLQASGCECPTTPSPDGPPASKNELWLSLVAGPMEVTLTQGFLQDVEPTWFTGVGLPKKTKCILPDDLWPTECCWCCDQMDADWACAGWLQTKVANKSMVHISTAGRTRWTLLTAYIGGASSTPVPASGVVQVGELTPAHFGGFLLWFPLAVRTLPPKQRDAAWTRASMSQPKPKTVYVSEWGPQHTAFQVDGATATVCRRLAAQTLTFADGSPNPLCKVVPASLQGRIAVAKPGAGAP